MPVVDRTATILDIFAGHAHTAEGKLQVELAQLEYNLARMRGLWTHLERLGGVSQRRLRDPRPGRVADRDRPPPRARPHRRAASAGSSDVKGSRATMRAERDARAPAAGRAGRLHERRQVDAAQRAHRRRGRRPRPALPHARPDDARRCGSTGGPYLADRHRRLHPQAAPPARRRVRRDAGGDAAGRPHPARRRRLGRRGRARRDAARRRRRARGDRRRRQPAAARAQQGRRARRRAPRASCGCRHPDGVLVSALDGRGARGARASAIEDEFRAHAAPRRAAAALRRGRPAGRAARRRRRPRARGHRRRACASARASRPPVAERYARFAVAADVRPPRAAEPRLGRRGRPAAVVRRLDACTAAVLPARAHDGDAGLDLHASRPRRSRAGRARVGPHRHRGRARRTGTPAWCCRARAWRRATASRSSTRPA